jgi:hypothetical protein
LPARNAYFVCDKYLIIAALWAASLTAMTIRLPGTILVGAFK